MSLFHDHAVPLYQGDAARRRKETVITTSTSPVIRRTAVRRPAVRGTVAAVGCAAVLLATAAACGTVENLSAGQKVDRAVEGLGEKKSLAFELGLDAEPSALVKLAGEAGADEELPPEFVKFLTGVRVKVSVESRKPLADSGEKDLVGTGVEFTGADGVLVEYRIVGDHTYYRADMKAVGKAMGFPLPTVDDLPESEKALAPVLEGKWVKVDNRALERAAKEVGAADEGGGTGGADEIDRRTQQKILKAVRSVVAREVTFRDEGGSDGVERIVAEASLRDLLTGVFDKVRPLSGELPAGFELPTDKVLKEAPDTKVAVDFSLKNGDLTRVSVDLAALVKSAKGTKGAKDAKGVELPLVVTFGEADDVSAPSGATKMPAGRFGGPLNGMMPGGF
ncbi:hypothetical protein [Streptomyces sp. MMBL 11-3]|uniref:hypothetical protein n=1 Tax=Streptomyces sp. MMBL 11-3 TaxID=3382639 RepID=UPI0039B66AD7